MDEQPEKENLRQSWRGSYSFWFRIWKPYFLKWWAFLSSPPVVLAEIFAIAIGLCYLVTLLPEYNPYGIAWLFYMSCCGTLAILLAILSAVTRGWTVYVVVLPLLLLDGFAATVPFSNTNLSKIFFLLPLLTAIPIQVVLESISVFCGTFSKSKATDQTFSEGLQFKTKHLFIVTTLIAVGIVSVQALVLSLPGGSYDDTFMMVVLIAILLGVNALVSVWAILGQTDGVRIVVSSISAIVFLLVFLSVLRYYIEVTYIYTFLVCMFFTVVAWGASTVQVFLLRGEGYRFVRHSR